MKLSGTVPDKNKTNNVHLFFSWVFINQNIMFSKTPIGLFCAQVTNTLFEHPVAGIFKVPAYQSPNDPYLQYIQKPMDLGTIKKKIKDNSYNNISEWKQDVDLVFDNAISYNTEQSVIGGVAIYLRKKFNKMLDKYSLTNRQNYEERLRQLYRELQSEMEKVYSLQLDKTLTPLYTTKELEEKLSYLSDSTQIEDIFKRHGLENLIKKGKTTINLDTLSRDCLDDLWRLVTN